MHSCFALVHYFPVMPSDSCNNILQVLYFFRLQSNWTKVSKSLSHLHHYWFLRALVQEAITGLGLELESRTECSLRQHSGHMTSSSAHMSSPSLIWSSASVKAEMESPGGIRSTEQEEEIIKLARVCLCLGMRLASVWE